MIFHLILAIVLSLVVQIFTHEIGHMIGGYVTGWKFICIQIFNLVLIKEQGSLKLRRIHRIGFQCIMYPKDIKQGAYLYTLSGCIANFILTAIAFAAMIVSKDNIESWFYSWCFFAIGVSMLLMNAIPSTKRLCNDMACYLLLKKDQVTMQSHNAQMMIAKRLVDGYSYRDIDEKLICLPVMRSNNDILAYHAVLEYYYWLDKGNYELMYAAICKIECINDISKGVLDIIKLEKLYIDLIIKLRNKDYSDLEMSDYGLDQEKYINLYKSEGDVHSTRIKTIYEVYKRHTNSGNKQINNIINKGIENIKSLPHIYLGEVDFCLNQLNLFREYFYGY